MQAYPTQMRMTDPINSDLPVHSVAAWDASDKGARGEKEHAPAATII
jgi:hypothetical protein